MDILDVIKSRRSIRRFKSDPIPKDLLVKVLEDVDKWAKKRNTRFVIVLDEAQELKIIPAWRKILA